MLLVKESVQPTKMKKRWKIENMTRLEQCKSVLFSFQSNQIDIGFSIVNLLWVKSKSRHSRRNLICWNVANGDEWRWNGCWYRRIGECDPDKSMHAFNASHFILDTRTVCLGSTVFIDGSCNIPIFWSTTRIAQYIGCKKKPRWMPARIVDDYW